MNPLAFLVLYTPGWMNRNQQEVIEYLPEETRYARNFWARNHIL